MNEYDKNPMTREQAMHLYNNGWWKGRQAKEVAKFQLFTDRLCMPFEDFHKSVEEALNRPVFTHEFGAPDMLRQEFLGERDAPTMEEIINLIPEEKRLVVAV